MQLQALRDLTHKAKRYTECRIRGHLVEEECKTRLNDIPSGVTFSTCKHCDTPLRLEKSKNDKIKVFERY